MASYNVSAMFISLIFIPFILAAELRDIQINEILKLQNMTIDEYINYINPPAVYKFKNINGDNVLCVKYEDQTPLRSGNIRKDSKNKFTHTNSTMKECIEGTVPILEISPEVVESYGSVTQFLNRRPIDRVHTDTVRKDGRDHEWAVVTMRADEIHEAKAKFNVYKFLVEQPDYSSVQIYFLHEISEGRTSKELMQTGFVVDPKRFGDRLIFYIFYRLHDRVDGCFNLECGGFIQDDRKYYPGMPMEHLSVYNGPQRDSLLSIRRTTTSNSNIVWAVYLQDTKVGHWPAIYFKDLIFAANRVDFGGEIAVSNNSPGTPFSKTDMGTGGFPKDGFGKATFVRNIELKTTKDVPILDMEKSYVATKSKCYGVKGSTSNDWGDYIYYGGPGGDNPKCKH